jgi:hypothetical protein
MTTQASYTAGVSLPTGQTLFATMWTVVGGVWRASDSVPFTAAAAPVLTATLTSPTANATMPQPAVFTWNAVPNAQAYVLRIGTTPGAFDLLAVMTTATSHTAPPLPAGQTLHATLWTIIDGVWRSAQSVPFTAAGQ